VVAVHALLDALHEASPRFAAEWARHEVLTEQLGSKTIDHRELGALRLHHLQSTPTSHPDLRLTQFVPADDATRAILARLR
jgi:MmyB-like transcription regulator ligand binding domain